jgi:hypothetical protein
LFKGYFPAQWKVAKIIYILKPGKPPNELIFYWKISLLSTVSKVFEKLLLKSRTDTSNHTKDKRSFLGRNNTVLQTFLDISQAIDKVWHTGLQYKLRWSFSLNYFLILNSYLHSRHFPVKVETEYTELSSVNEVYPKAVS